MNDFSKMPLLFDDNRIQRPYIGGTLLNQWRKMEPSDDGHHCEELVVTSIGAIVKGQPEGYAISKTIPSQGSRSLNDIIAEDPAAILGKTYQEANPNQLSVLCRVGDTIVRLVIQCHPKKQDAMKYFHTSNGKTEAWYIVQTRGVEGKQNCVYAGFKPHVTRTLWRDLCFKQDVDAMIDCLHQLPVKQGDVVLIPAGMPHAMGPGCLFLEIHECSDITIRAERTINGVTLTDEEMFYGLSMEDGIGLFDFTTYTSEEIIKQVMMQEEVIDSQQDSQLLSVIDERNTKAFGMQIVLVKGSFKLPEFDGHRVLVAMEQDVMLQYGNDKIIATQGQGVLLPADCKDITIVASAAKVMIGLPPVQG